MQKTLFLNAFALALAVALAVISPRPARADEPAAIDLRYQQAKADLQAGNHVAALDTFKRLLKEAEGDTVRTWTMLMAIAAAYEQLGQEKEALEYFNRLLLHMQHHPEALTPDWTTRKRVAEGRVRVHEATMLASKGLIKVQTQPQGARIFVDGVPQGMEGDLSTPGKLYLAPGTHEIRFEKGGHGSGAVKVRVEVGQRENILVTLEAQGPATLVVHTHDAGAAVFVDGARVGGGAAVRHDLGAGSYELMVTRPGYRVIERTVTVEADEELSVDVEWRDLAAPDGDAASLVAAPVREHAGYGDRGMSQLWGWLSIGTGGACLLVGGTFNILAVQTINDMNSLDREKGRDAARDEWDDLDGTLATRRAVSGTFYGLGAAAVLGGGAYLLLFADHAPWSVWSAGRPAGLPALAVTPWQEGALISAGWSW
jgi:hypothetical protein